MPLDPAIEESIAAIVRLGRRFLPVDPAELERLRDALGAPLAQHAWLEVLARFGVLDGPGPYAMLSPEEVLDAREAQQAFYEGASFGDRPEDEQNLEREARFRASLVPFQRCGSSADFFCFVLANQTADGPLILDAYHDDFELVSGGDALTNPRVQTVYTRSFSQHLAWVAQLLADPTQSYPPASCAKDTPRLRRPTPVVPALLPAASRPSPAPVDLLSPRVHLVLARS